MMWTRDWTAAEIIAKVWSTEFNGSLTYFLAMKLKKFKQALIVEP